MRKERQREIKREKEKKREERIEKLGEIEREEERQLRGERGMASRERPARWHGGWLRYRSPHREGKRLGRGE